MIGIDQQLHYFCIKGHSDALHRIVRCKELIRILCLIFFLLSAVSFYLSSIIKVQF